MLCFQSRHVQPTGLRAPEFALYRLLYHPWENFLWEKLTDCVPCVCMLVQVSKLWFPVFFFFDICRLELCTMLCCACPMSLLISLGISNDARPSSRFKAPAGHVLQCTVWPLGVVWAGGSWCHIHLGPGSWWQPSSINSHTWCSARPSSVYGLAGAGQSTAIHSGWTRGMR